MDFLQNQWVQDFGLVIGVVSSLITIYTCFRYKSVKRKCQVVQGDYETINNKYEALKIEHKNLLNSHNAYSSYDSSFMSVDNKGEINVGR